MNDHDVCHLVVLSGQVRPRRLKAHLKSTASSKASSFCFLFVFVYSWLFLFVAVPSTSAACFWAANRVSNSVILRKVRET